MANKIFVFSLFGASLLGLCNTATAQETTKQPLNELHLSVEFSQSFVDAHISQDPDYGDICKVLGSSLEVGKGPWGFGLFNTGVDCRFEKNAPKAVTMFDWTLRVGLNSENLGQLQLCRPMSLTGATEKCESTVIIPAKQYLPRLLVNKEFVRILAAAILDQAPFRSRITKNLMNAAGELKSAPEKAITAAYQIPPFTGKLMPVSAQVHTDTGMFVVKLEKNFATQRLNGASFWAVTMTRGGMEDSMNAAIVRSTEFAGALEQRKDMLDASAREIIGRNERREAKKYRGFFGKIEAEAEIRAGISFRDKKDFGQQLNFEGLLSKSVFENLWIESQYALGSYQYDVELQIPAASNQKRTAVAKYSLVEASLGYGGRWSSHSDHTIFAYPRIEVGKLTWDAPGVSIDTVDSSLTAVSFESKMVPTIGGVLGYESPESWPIHIRASLTGASINGENRTSYSAALFAQFPIPRGRFMSALLGAHHSEIVGFASSKLSSYSSGESTQDLQSFEFSALDYGFGLGYRLFWR
jgi:hypothetical protein